MRRFEVVLVVSFTVLADEPTEAVDKVSEYAILDKHDIPWLSKYKEDLKDVEKASVKEIVSVKEVG